MKFMKNQSIITKMLIALLWGWFAVSVVYIFHLDKHRDWGLLLKVGGGLGMVSILWMLFLEDFYQAMKAKLKTWQADRRHKKIADRHYEYLRSHSEEIFGFGEVCHEPLLLDREQFEWGKKVYLIHDLQPRVDEVLHDLAAQFKSACDAQRFTAEFILSTTEECELAQETTQARKDAFWTAHGFAFQLGFTMRKSFTDYL